jgi:septum formation protein
MKLILASASPRRKELLGHLKLPFTIETKNVPEESDHLDPVKFSEEIAVSKGQAVFEDHAEDCLVVSADTIVVLDGRIYGKPGNESEARRYLSDLSGRTHSVYTAVSLLWRKSGTEQQHSFVEESKVTFNPIGTELMDRYLATGDSLDKAGAYGIQGPSLTFISRVEGDYANVVGFPLSRFVTVCGDLLGDSWFNLFS